MFGRVQAARYSNHTTIHELAQRLCQYSPDPFSSRESGNRRYYKRPNCRLRDETEIL